ncbi:MAG TPA: YihY/virulence factor BrkB family protein [Flavobacteriaceae bacterium]|nr:YihY/virulence factor BrkB family protein [Flavobacteriaceae bacterium]
MKKSTDDTLRILGSTKLIKLTKKIRLPGMDGFTLYNLLGIYGKGIFEGSFSARAGSIAYSFFLALFPFLLFLLNLIPHVPIEGFQTRFLLFVESLLPPQTGDFFYPIIADIAVNRRTQLLSFVFILSIFLTTNGVNAIFSAFQHSYHVADNRGFVKQYAVALGVSVLLAVVLIISVGVILYGEYVIRDFRSLAIIKSEIKYISYFQFLIFAFMIYTIIAILFYFGTKKGKKSSFFSLSAGITAALFLITTYFFGIYINNFSNYNEIYGSIGALLILMVYIWINSNLLLLGFELEASLQQLRSRMRK